MTYKLWPLGSKVTYVCSVVLCNPPIEVEKFCLLWLDRYWFFQRTLKIWKLLCWEKKYPIQICNPKWGKKNRANIQHDWTLKHIDIWHVMSMSCPKILTSKMQLSLHYAALQRKSACLAFPKAIFHALITMI